MGLSVPILKHFRVSFSLYLLKQGSLQETMKSVQSFVTQIFSSYSSHKISSTPGHVCLKLTTSLVNVSLKF